MAKVSVSIVSDQTIPNYLFIKEFQDKIDKFIFIMFLTGNRLGMDFRNSKKKTQNSFL